MSGGVPAPPGASPERAHFFVATFRPFVACRDRWRGIAALKGLPRFRRAYHAAPDAFVGGIRDVLFPAGTFALVRLGVAVAPS